MIPTYSSCDDQQIGRFLNDCLTPEEQQTFEQHLSDCAVCRSLLDARSAEPAWWEHARELLSDDDDDGCAAQSFLTGTSLNEELVLKSLAPTDLPTMLGRLGAYEIAGVIGSGGMGVVLKGFDTALHRFVAVKVLSPHLAESAAARRRFAREAQAAAAVVHENVIAIHGVSESCGLPYLVMPYERGASLQRRLDQLGVLQTPEILRVAMQTAAGLSAAHQQGLVHRDIKPANLLLADGVERVTITDFGLARAVDDASMTRTGYVPGTPQYMSPEQAAGEAVDFRSDLFSLGSVIYTMCTGRPPFRADSSLAVLRKICETDPTPIRAINPEIPAWLEAIVGKLHRKSPDARFASAAEVAQLLERCLAHVQQPQSARLPADLATLDFSTARERKWHAPLLATLALLIFFSVTWLSQTGLIWPKSEQPVTRPSSTVLPGDDSPVRSLDSQHDASLADGNTNEQPSDIELTPPATTPTREQIVRSTLSWQDDVDEELRAIDWEIAALMREVLNGDAADASRLHTP